MAIYENIETFWNLPVEAYNPEKGIQNESAAIRLGVDYEAADSGAKLITLLKQLTADPKAGAIKALVLGEWEESYETGASEFIDFLVEQASTFHSLKAVFIGEMTVSENEISWIVQGDYQAFWDAYPQLEMLTIRGGNELRLGKTISHHNLKQLVIESGGLGSDVLRQIANASLPALEHLELWLGDENYGWDGTSEDIHSLLSATRFPKLKHLALKNSEIQDEVAQLLVQSEILPQLESIDMSMGVMSDTGAQALLLYKDRLIGKSFDLSQNYLSDEMVNQLKAAGLNVKADDQDESDDEDDRYVSVSE